MTNLLSESLREVLCKILFGVVDETHLSLVVPLQGNFENPQQINKISAYFTYYVSNTTKKLINTEYENDHIANVVRTVELSCVGKDAELLMLNTLFWDERVDVRALLNEYGTVLMDTPRTILARPLVQQGMNTILSYTTTIKLSSQIRLSSDWQSWGQPEDLVLLGGLVVQE